MFPIQTRTPPLRASDFDLAIRDPFLYFLKVRCGLIPALSYSKALSRGSWFHKALELEDIPNGLEFVLDARKSELAELGSHLNLTPEKIQDIQDRETKDAATMSSVFSAAKDIPAITLPSGEIVSFGQYYNQPQWKLLASELLLFHAPTRSACQIDRLYLNIDYDLLWLVDAKTTDIRPDIRGQICPIESATPHYLSTTKNLLPELIAHFDLDGVTRVGGMLHLIVQKPTIEMCNEDRDHRFVEHRLKSGPRKGQIEMRKEYLSDTPSLANYIGRCKRWMLGEAEYLDRSAERFAFPCVNQSSTPYSVAFESGRGNTYRSKLDNLERLIHTDNLDVGVHIPNVSGLLEQGKLSAYAPFYLCPPEQWLEIIARNGFLQVWRNPEITLETPSFIGTPANANASAPL